jgi:hypothetical protein
VRRMYRFLSIVTLLSVGASSVCIALAVARAVRPQDSTVRLVLFIATLSVQIAGQTLLTRLDQAPLLNLKKVRWGYVSPLGARTILPLTLGGLFLTFGFASSDYPPDWVGSAIGAMAAWSLARYGLDRYQGARLEDKSSKSNAKEVNGSPSASTGI